MKQNFDRVRLFCRLLRTPSSQHKKLGVREAWHVAGISAGKIVPMPDDIIAWWWQIQDVVKQDTVRQRHN